MYYKTTAISEALKSEMRTESWNLDPELWNSVGYIKNLYYSKQYIYMQRAFSSEAQESGGQKKAFEERENLQDLVIEDHAKVKHICELLRLEKWAISNVFGSYPGYWKTEIESFTRLNQKVLNGVICSWTVH